VGGGHFEPCDTKISENCLRSHYNTTALIKMQEVLIQNEKIMGSANQKHGSKCPPPPTPYN